MKTQPTKLAVLFPGIGYHCDKPLLYYAGKACKQRGYTVLPMPYGKLTDMDKEAAFEKALKASRKAMKKQMPWEGEDLLFISKSIGTVVASRLTEELDLPARHLYFTPVMETLPFLKSPSLAFSGLADPWVDPAALKAAFADKGLPLTQYPDCNHSLETGEVGRDLALQAEIFRAYRDFLE